MSKELQSQELSLGVFPFPKATVALLVSWVLADPRCFSSLSPA